MHFIPAPQSHARAVWIAAGLVAFLVIGSLAPSATRPAAAGTANTADAGRVAVAARAAGSDLSLGGRGSTSPGLTPADQLQLAYIKSVPDPGPLSGEVTVSPFYPDGDGVRDTTAFVVTLRVPASLDITVLDFDGAVIRRLTMGTALPPGRSAWTWDGTRRHKGSVPDGPYRFHIKAVTPRRTYNLDRWVTKAQLVPYPAAPGAIVVALDPGHGGPDSGAYYSKIREADMNLNIALRLQAALGSTGIQVVMTRTRDRAVNDPAVDVSGDGEVTHEDELIARNDVANIARADLHVVLMNNAYGCHCAHGTETYTSGHRAWTPEGVDLARYIQAAHMNRLRAFRSATWAPRDRGVKLWHFAAVRPYKKKAMPRPSLMPSVLVESLFMDQRNELAVLGEPTARSAIAMAYYDGIVRWLARRDYGLRYDVLSASTALVAGTSANYRLRLTNRGNRSSSGWVLEARQVPAGNGPYDGSKVRGTFVAETRIPDGLRPGQQVRVNLLGVPTPTVAGDWLVKFDVRLSSGSDSLLRHGVVGPQLRLTTTQPPPSSGPSSQRSDSRDEVASGIDLGNGFPGAAAFVRYDRSQPWRRYVSPLGIRPDSDGGQNGLDGGAH